MAKLTKEHLKYLKSDEFFEAYMTLLLARLTYSNNKLEEDGLNVEKLYAAEHTDTLEDNIKALGIIIEQIRFIYELRNSLNKVTDEEKRKRIEEYIKKGQKLTPSFIIKLANIINKHSANGSIKAGYRTGTEGDHIKFANKYSIEKAANIKRKMRELLNNYYGPWSKLDVFEREARFHIEFLRIHPFGDGNGRTSRLILNYNLILQGHAPVLLPADIKSKYFTARNKENVEWIKKLFERESEKELNVINHRIDTYLEEREREYLL